MILEAPLHYRCLERDKLKGLEQPGGEDKFDNKMVLSSESKKELSWWIENVHRKNGKRMRPKSVDFICRTDSSLLGWGAYMI